MTKIKNSVDKNVEQLELSCIALGSIILENSWHFLLKLSMRLPSDPAIPLLGIYLTEEGIYPHKANT